MSFQRIPTLLILMCMQSVVLLGCANDRPKDLVVDVGGGGAIHLVGKADNFDCSDPAFANIKKVVTTTMVFADGSSMNICAEPGEKRKSVPSIGAPSVSGGAPRELFREEMEAMARLIADRDSGKVSSASPVEPRK